MEKREYKELFMIIGTTAAVYLSFKYLLPLVAPFLVSLLLARLLLPAVLFLKKRLHIAKGIGGTFLIGALVTGLGLVVLEAGRLLLTQLGQLLKNFPIYRQLLEMQTRKLCCHCDRLFHMEAGESFGLVESGIQNMGVVFQTKVLPELSRQTVFGVGKIFSAVWIIFLIFLGAFLIVKDSEDLKIIWEESVLHQKGHKVFEKLSQTGLAYGKAQLIIMGITMVLCSVGIFMTGNPYSLLIGSVIAVLDALPAIGSGIILIPWTIFKVLKGQLFHGALLITVYALCQIVRQLVESKIIGDRLEVKPIFTIIAMYAGIRLFGIMGFILGPAALVIIKVSLQSLW